MNYTEWVSYYCLAQNDQFYSYFRVTSIYIQWNNDDVRFLLDQHAQLNFNSDSSRKQQSLDRHIILIASQQGFALTPKYWVPNIEVTNTNVIVFSVSLKEI